MQKKIFTILLILTSLLITACGNDKKISNENNTSQEIDNTEQSIDINLNNNLNFVGNFLNFYSKLPEKQEPKSLLLGNINTPPTIENIFKNKNILSYDLENTNGGNLEEFKEYTIEDLINNQELIAYNSASEIMLYLNEETYDRYDITFINNGTGDIEGENTRTFGDVVNDNFWYIGTPFLRQLGELFEIKGFENIKLSEETKENYHSFAVKFFQKYGCPDKIYIDSMSEFTTSKITEEYTFYQEYFIYEFDEYIMYLCFTDYIDHVYLSAGICSEEYLNNYIINDSFVKLYWTNPNLEE